MTAGIIGKSGGRLPFMPSSNSYGPAFVFLKLTKKYSMNFSLLLTLFFKDFFGQNNYCFLTQGHLLKRGGVVNASEDLGGNCLSRHLFSSRKKETINNIQIPTHQLSIIYMLKLAESVCKSHIWRNCNNYFQSMYLVYCNWIFQSLFSHQIIELENT